MAEKDFDNANFKVIEIYYGPYESNGIIRHKTQRLYGLKSEY